jgi:hypothetical protein
MTDSIRIATLALAGVGLLALPTATSGQAGATAKSAALCLPVGVSSPSPCGAARAGQAIRLQVATTSLPSGPIRLLFVEEPQAGQAQRRANVIVAPELSRDGGYDIIVPRELCAGRAGGNFEIQNLVTEVNQAEGSGPSLGMLTVAC